MTEKQFENSIKRYLRDVGVYPLGTPKNEMLVPPVGYYEKRHGSMFTKSGLPDMHICIHGHSLEVEIKKEGGKPSPLQLFMIDQINDAGGHAFVIWPEDFDEFKTTIKDYL